MPCTIASPLADSGSRITSKIAARSAYFDLKNGLSLSFLAVAICPCAFANAAASSLIAMLVCICPPSVVNGSRSFAAAISASSLLMPPSNSRIAALSPSSSLSIVIVAPCCVAVARMMVDPLTGRIA